MWLSGTGDAFARGYLRRVETVIAFAGEKWVFLACFSVAEVSPVSRWPASAVAVVMAVSRWPASAAAEVLLVSISPRRRVLCAQMFAQRADNIPKSVFFGLLGEFFAEEPLEGLCWVSFFAPIGPASVLDAMRCTSGWLWLGGLRHAKLPNGVSELWMASFPPIGGGDLAVCGGVVAKLQTHSVKRAQIRLFRLNGSTIWRNRSLSWCVVRASLPEHAPQSLVAHSAACRGINRLTSCESCYTTVLSSNEAKSGRD